MNSSCSAEKVQGIPGLWHSSKWPIQSILMKHFVITVAHKIILPLPYHPAEQRLESSCASTVGSKGDVPQGVQGLWEPTSSVAPWSPGSGHARGHVVSLKVQIYLSLSFCFKLDQPKGDCEGPCEVLLGNRDCSLSCSVWANPRTGPSDQLDVRALAKHHGCLGNCYQISVYKYKILHLAWVLKLTSRQASPPTKAQ